MNIIASLATATFVLLASTPVASASDRCSRARVVTVDYCAPSYICTKELCRRTEFRWAKDPCGRRYCYEVTMITFADLFSDGSRRINTKAYRA